METVAGPSRRSSTTKAFVVVGLALVLLAVVIVGVFGGAIAAGVLGVVLPAPVIATARVVGRHLGAHLYDAEPAAAVAAGGDR